MRLLLLFACVAPVVAGSHVYTILPAAGSRLALVVEKTGLMSGRQHLFLFERYRGTLDYDPEAPERSRVDLVIEASSAVCKDTWVSAKDLQKIQKYALADMLDASQHPELHFASTAITRRGAATYLVEGMLTIRGIARPVVVNVTVDPDVSAVDGSAVVKMRDYGLKPPTAALGAIGTRNEMKVDFRLLPVPTASSSPAAGRRTRVDRLGAQVHQTEWRISPC